LVRDKWDEWKPVFPLVSSIKTTTSPTVATSRISSNIAWYPILLYFTRSTGAKVYPKYYTGASWMKHFLLNVVFLLLSLVYTLSRYVLLLPSRIEPK
jgi:hypothetical protein